MQQDVDAAREAEEKQRELVADPQQAAILESYRLAHDQRNATCILEQADRVGWPAPHGGWTIEDP
jgi:hypothetical protein